MAQAYTVLTLILLLISHVCPVPKRRIPRSNDGRRPVLVQNEQGSGFPNARIGNNRPSFASQSVEQNQEIVFSETVTPTYRVQEKPNCYDDEGGKGFCEKDPDYNQEIQSRFDAILTTSPLSNMIMNFLNETVSPVDKSEKPVVRLGDPNFTSEQTVCRSRKTIIYPNRGQTPTKEWVFILNQGTVKQGVKVDKCMDENSQCVLGGGPLQNTACRQKFIYKKLLSMDMTGKNIVPESVYLPSCCVCYVSNLFVSPRKNS